MQALTELNQQLQEENKTAIDVMTEHKDEIKQQTKTIAKSQQERDIIGKQLQQLQNHYHKKVQQQVEIDHRFAHKLQADMMKNIGAKGKGVFIDSDGENENQSVYGNTAGGPTDIEKKLFEKYAMSHDEKQEDDYDIDIEEEQSGMFDHMVSRKQKSDNVLKQKQREMMELERKMKTLQQQMTDDEKFAKDLYNKQLDEHNKRMEEERRKQELEREKYIEKHYISADKITVTKG
eukprot:739809_1